jgi:hypothetical protein
MNNYMQFRGKCKELSEAEVKKDPALKLVRGHYICPMWGKQPHWWCVKPDGTIVDPSVDQFPTNGIAAEYVPFDGNVDCAACGKNMKEHEARFESNYAFCSTICIIRFVGL